MNTFYTKALVILVAALVLAIPAGLIFQSQNQQINNAQQKADYFQSDSKKKELELKKLDEQQKIKDAEQLKLKQENEQLKKDLQAKRDKQAADAKLAAAQQNAAASGSCRSAIAQVWYGGLQSGAITVMQHENRAENPNAIGAVNSDGSQDFGCFQINNKAHAAFFASNDWRDPVANAKYALQIYQERANNPRLYKNGWTAWYAVEGILW